MQEESPTGNASREEKHARTVHRPVALCALGTMYGFLFCLYAGDALFFGWRVSQPQALVCRIAVLLGTALFILLLSSGGAHRFFARRSPLLVEAVQDIAMVAALLVPLATFHLLDGVGFSWPIVVAWGLYGFPCACLYLYASALLCTFRRGETVGFMASSTLLGGAVFFILTLLPFPANSVLGMLLPVISYLFYYQTNAGRDQERHERLAELSGARHFARPAWDSIMYTLCACIGMGMGLQLAVSGIAQPGVFAGSAVAGLAIVVASLIMIADQHGRRLVDEDRTSRYLYVAIFAPLFFALPFRGPQLLFVGVALVVLLWCVLIVGASTEAETAHSESLNAESALSRGWALSVTGMAIGMLLVHIGIDAFDQELIVFAIEVAAFALFVFIAIARLARPVQPKGRNGEEEHLETIEPVAAPPGHPASASVVKPVSGTSEGPFRRKCNRIADRYGLSPRQREVFILLAHGRNRKYIQDELVISRGTVDTHTYNIYRKTGVHSRQELIDLIEQFHEDDEPGADSRKG